MCGIAGMFDTRGGRAPDRGVLERMTDIQQHRGPDGRGFHVEAGVGLGHRRLSIIDLSGGAQPLANEDGSVLITFNGEIYNFQELRTELLAAGHQFRTASDTETIVHAWEQWGEACVERFVGMLAFAVFDRKQRTLFLARDRFGEKPLYYSLLPDGWLVFASELKGLLQHPGLRRELDPLAVEDYFAFGYVPEPRSILRGVAKLPPAHMLTVRVDAPLPQPREYWDLAPFFQRRHGLDDTAAAAEVVTRLRSAVNRQMISEVPLGAFLSGGVDSSAIVSQMAELSPHAVKTCSIAFNDPRFDESRFAQMVADRYATDHSTDRVEPDDFELIDQLGGLYDEPFADSSSLPTYRVCQLARNRVTVALSGDAGDENFGGYRRYKWHTYEERVRGYLPYAVRAPLFGLAGSLYPKLDWAPRFLRAKSTFQSLARSSLEGYFHSVSILAAELRGKLYSDSFRRDLQGYDAKQVFERFAGRVEGWDALSTVQYLDFRTYLPGDILTKVDRASMANSLEVRVPMLDHEFAEWVAGLEPTQKLRGAEGKYVLKQAMHNYLPHEIMYRAKMGFAVPIVHWFRGPLRAQVREAVLGQRLADAGVFDRAMLERLVDQHQSGARDHSPALWALMMFERFIGRVLDPATPTADAARSHI
ncbi:MAG: amidotransferase 1, exosortase A system-associated [Proteobacteria bacterium]|nr:amidotransferase 1, exosortase A system-associated [Pseudomonadota bacterium]